MIKVIVLSLKSANERREKIEQQLNALKIDFIFFDAIEITDDDMINSEIYLDSVAKEKIGFSMTRSEVSCALGHIKIYNKYFSSCDGVVVLEDDVIVSDRFFDFLVKINCYAKYKPIKDEFFMLGGQEFLEQGREAVFGRRARLSFGGFSVHKAFFSKYKIKGTFGYFMGANCMRHASEKALPIVGRADDWARFIDLNIIQNIAMISPTVIIHPPIANGQSSILDNEVMGRDNVFRLHGFRWRFALAIRLIFSVFY